ncbi:MAG: flagellar motor protein [Burkholderiales bacterium]|nr:flagellar motor protein [Burkholderiales bacterium]
MDFISIVGILLAGIAIIGGQILEGGHVGSLLQVTAFVIVIGGTAGAVMLQSTLPTFLRGMRMVKWVFVPPPLAADALIQSITQWSTTARKGGLLALEPVIDEIADPFVKKGLQMLVDGAEPETLRETLQLEIDAYEEQQRQAARVWESAGGYAPTIGILGAVLGLIHVMENLSDPSKLGAGIAVAFVATVYGVGSANLLFLPIANKLKGIIAREITLRHMLVEGLVSVANGENPRLIERKLRGFLA